MDSLRAIAAGLVMWLHFEHVFAPVASPGPAFLNFLHTLPHALDPGRIGVMMFFAVSGFVISHSFGGPAEGRTGRFLIKRFCRLYPAYWCSMLGGICLLWLDRQGPTLPNVAANATMLPGWMGQPPLLGVYWTLEIELLFYGLLLALSWLRCLTRPGLLTAGTLLLVSLPRVLRAVDRGAGTHLTLSPDLSLLTLSLAVMFWGVVFRLAYEDTGGFRRGPFWRWSTFLTVLGALALIDVPDPNFRLFLLGLRPGALPGQASVACAVVGFVLWVGWLRIDQPTLTYLGMISYSLYLFHWIVAVLLAALAKAAGWHLPLAAYFLAGVSLSVAVAAAVYAWVERPAMAFGGRWVRSYLGSDGDRRAR